MKHIELEGGIKITTYQPPKDFDPLTAAPLEVLRHGFPPRPDNPHRLEQYSRIFNRLKSRFHYIQPTFRVNPNRFHGPRQRLTTELTETSNNWSGGVVFAPSGGSFQCVLGDWIIPNVSAPTDPTPNEWYYCASWIGIDGDGSPDVCQAGVESQVMQFEGSMIRYFIPWWEWYPLPTVEITNLAVSAGDLVHVQIFAPQAAGSTTATVYFANMTSGASTSFTITAPSGTALVGNSAEWIVEAPGAPGSQTPLADYGQVTFSKCQATSRNLPNPSTVVDGGTGDNINMTVGGAMVSAGNLIDPTTIQCVYE
jgi:hypothetical protein